METERGVTTTMGEEEEEEEEHQHWQMMILRHLHLHPGSRTSLSRTSS